MSGCGKHVHTAALDDPVAPSQAARLVLLMAPLAPASLQTPPASSRPTAARRQRDARIACILAPRPTAPCPVGPRLIALCLAVLLGLTTACAGDTVDLRGSGASFPETVYRNWIVEYCREHDDIRITYAPKGSSTGIADITAGLVDFAGSDAAMSDTELAAAHSATGDRIRMLPMTAGGIVVAYNVAGRDDLRLSRRALAGIFLGEITRWNDPAITTTNPGADLPDEKIHVVYRSDGSGTSFAFTGHLAAISPAFDAEVGRSKSPAWPVGSGAPKNAGVAAQIKSNPFTIGYVEYSFAKDLQSAWLQNRAGNFVAPTLATMANALDNLDLPSNLRTFEFDPPGTDSFPIVSLTWLLVYETYPADKLDALRSFLHWCLTEGQQRAAPSGYVALPERMTRRVLAAVAALRLDTGPSVDTAGAPR